MKSKAIDTINKYLPLLEVSKKDFKLQALPIMYQKIYDFEQILINQNPYLVINVKVKNLGPKDFKRHSKFLKEKMGHTLIWCLNELHFNKIIRMIRNGMNFIIVDKHVHLPAINTSIKIEKEHVVPDKSQLTGLGINIIIRQIIKKDLDGKNKQEMAHVFGANQMMISRSIGPLIRRELCYEKKEGVSKFVNFTERGDLYEFFKKNIKSPVKEVIYLDKIIKGLPYSGITALSEKGMLTDDEIPTFAISKKEFKKKYKDRKLVLEEFAKAKIELWDREPTLIENSCINLLDIYLVNKDVEDERVQIQLDRIHTWLGI